jgi:hypothetical protein
LDTLRRMCDVSMVKARSQERVTAEQPRAWLWALLEWRRCSWPPSSRASPATPTPMMVSDSCSLYALIFLQLKHMFGLAYKEHRF